MAVLATSPLAYLGGMWFAWRMPERPAFTLDRGAIIQAVTRFAAARGIDVTGWRASLGFNQSDKELGVVLRHVSSKALEAIATPLTAEVLLRSPDSKQWLRAKVAPRGQVIGFQRSEPPADKLRPVDEAAARTIAEQTLRDRLGVESPFALEYKNVRTSDKSGQRRTFRWESRVPGIPEAHAGFHVQAYFDQVVSEGADVSFDEGYVDRFRPFRKLTTGLEVAGGIYVAILGIYALIRYIRRSTEKEVSHRRTLMIVAAFVILASVTLIGDPGALAAKQPGPPFGTAQLIAMFVVMVISMSFVGGFMGIAYGAGEGALRECFAGKLTSLDALLSGKVFSANVAHSILVGGGFAGWALLVQNAALFATHAAPEITQQTLVRNTVSSLPLLALLMDIGTDALLLMTFGVLLPFAFLRPRIRRSGLFYALLPAFSVLCAALVASGQTAQNFVITQLIVVAVTYAPFFFSDLLAATVGIFALRFVGTLAGLSFASETWLQTTSWVAAIGLAVLAAEVYFARRGRLYEEWEVRPRYAKYLAEHLAMQAEIGAARQAQMRLLPDAPPTITGLSIAGSCVPSQEVGGDFFDFYALDDHRLGIFLAEGGNRQLGSAMTIALAKGYLLYATRLEHSPAEILRRLRGLLTTTFHADGEVCMLYAAIDARAGTLRYARIGVSPHLVINGNEAAEEVAPGDPDEKVIRLGAANLAPNDAIVFYSDGFEGQIVRQKRQPANRYLAKIVKDIRSGTAADLHAAMLQAAIRKKSEQPADDVTAVVVRLNREADRMMEVVA